MRTEPQLEELLEQIEKRAENLFLTRQLQCAEAVITVLNQGLGGGLPSGMAVRLASGLPEGLGQRGCLCGALNGGALALGLFLGRDGPGYGNGRTVKQAAGQLHDQFKACFKATCCRVLTKSLVYGSDEHFRHCAQMTGTAARLTASIVLKHRPELVKTADWDYLARQESRMAAEVKKLARAFGR